MAGFFESQSKAIDAAVPLALKLHEMNRNAAAATAKLQQDAAQFAETLKATKQKTAIDALKATVEAGGEITDDQWKAVTGSTLPRQTYEASMEAPSESVLRSQLVPLENLQVSPIDDRSEEEAMFGTPATRFNVTGQKIIQPVSEATKKLQATIVERLAAADEKKREFDASLALREQLARIADATRREGIDSRNLLQEGLNELRRQGLSIQQGNLDARREENQRRIKELEGKLSGADKARLSMIEAELSSGQVQSTRRAELTNQADSILSKYEKPAAGTPAAGGQAPKFDPKQFPEFEPGSKTKRRIYTDPSGKDFIMFNGTRKDITIDAQGRIKF